MKRQIKILLILIFLFLILSGIISPKYIPDPLYLSHGRGMEAGDNWDTLYPVSDGYDFRMRNTDSNIAISQYFKDNYQIPTYFGIYSGNGYGSIFNWGNEMGSYLNQFKNEYETTYGVNFNKFNVVGYSAGGLAARWYLARTNDKLIKKLTTLNTPHMGGFLAVVAMQAHYLAPVCLTIAGIYAGLAIAFPLNPDFTKNAIFYSVYAVLLLILQVAFDDPPYIWNNINLIDIDLMPGSPFLLSLFFLESINQHKEIDYNICYSDGSFFNMNLTEYLAFQYAILGTADFSAKNYEQILNVSNWENFIKSENFALFLYTKVAALGYCLLASSTFSDGDLASSVSSQKGLALDFAGIKLPGWYGNLNADFFDSKYEHRVVTKRVDLMLKTLDDPSSLAVENSNTLTAVKMEPDGCYVNIQKPEIHIDGSCDDYLIQWIGDNDRIRLRYDKFSNIDEVIKLKNTEAGVFDYQRAGDVGRGWFSQKHTLQAGGENKIKIVAKNAANEESNKIKRTYYAVGLKYPSDNDEAVNMSSPVVWKVLNKTTGEISRRFWNPSIDIESFPEYVTQIADDCHIIGPPYVYDLNDEPNKDVEFESFDGVNLTIRLKNDYEKTVFKELEGNAEGPNYNKFEINYKVGPAYYDIDYAKHTDNPIDNPSVIDPKYYTVNNVPSDLKQNYQGTVNLLTSAIPYPGPSYKKFTAWHGPPLEQRRAGNLYSLGFIMYDKGITQPSFYNKSTFRIGRLVDNLSSIHPGPLDPIFIGTKYNKAVITFPPDSLSNSRTIDFISLLPAISGRISGEIDLNPVNIASFTNLANNLLFTPIGHIYEVLPNDVTLVSDKTVTVTVFFTNEDVAKINLDPAMDEEKIITGRVNTYTAASLANNIGVYIYDRTDNKNELIKVPADNISYNGLDIGKNMIIFRTNKIDHCNYLLLPANKKPVIDVAYASPFLFAPKSSATSERKTKIHYRVKTYTAPEVWIDIFIKDKTGNLIKQITRKQYQKLIWTPEEGFAGMFVYQNGNEISWDGTYDNNIISKYSKELQNKIIGTDGLVKDNIYTIELVAWDGLGNSETAVFYAMKGKIPPNIRLIDNKLTDEHKTYIPGPLEPSQYRQPIIISGKSVTIVGTAEGPSDFKGFEVQYAIHNENSAEHNEADWVSITLPSKYINTPDNVVRSFVRVTNDVLCVLDSTQLQDGYYDFRVIVHYSEGYFSSETIYGIKVDNDIGIYNIIANPNPFKTQTQLLFKFTNVNISDINATITNLDNPSDVVYINSADWEDLGNGRYGKIFNPSILPSTTTLYKVQFNVTGKTTTMEKQALASIILKCIPNGNNIVADIIDIIPQKDGKIYNIVEIKGLAFNDIYPEDFRNYVLEYSTTSPDNWVPFIDNARDVGPTQGKLGIFNTTLLTNSPIKFKLTVYDDVGNFKSDIYMTEINNLIQLNAYPQYFINNSTTHQHSKISYIIPNNYLDNGYIIKLRIKQKDNPNYIAKEEILTSSEGELTWDGTDDSGYPVVSHYILEIVVLNNEEEIAKSDKVNITVERSDAPIISQLNLNFIGEDNGYVTGKPYYEYRIYGKGYYNRKLTFTAKANTRWQEQVFGHFGEFPLNQFIRPPNEWLWPRHLRNPEDFYIVSEWEYVANAHLAGPNFEPSPKITLPYCLYGMHGENDGNGHFREYINFITCADNVTIIARASTFHMINEDIHFTVNDYYTGKEIAHTTISDDSRWSYTYSYYFGKEARLIIPKAGYYKLSIRFDPYQSRYSYFDLYFLKTENETRLLPVYKVLEIPAPPEKFYTYYHMGLSGETIPGTNSSDVDIIYDLDFDKCECGNLTSSYVSNSTYCDIVFDNKYIKPQIGITNPSPYDGTKFKVNMTGNVNLNMFGYPDGISITSGEMSYEQWRNTFFKKFEIGSNLSPYPVVDNILTFEKAYKDTIPVLQVDEYKRHRIFNELFEQEAKTGGIYQKNNVFIPGIADFGFAPYVSKWEITGPYYPPTIKTGSAVINPDIIFKKIKEDGNIDNITISPHGIIGFYDDTISPDLSDNQPAKDKWVLSDSGYSDNKGQDQFVPVFSGNFPYEGKIFIKLTGTAGTLLPGEKYVVEYKKLNENQWNLIKDETVTKNTNVWHAYWEVTGEIGAYKVKVTTYDLTGLVKESVVRDIAIGQKILATKQPLPITDAYGFLQLNFPFGSLKNDKLIQISPVKEEDIDIFNEEFKPIGPVFSLESYTINSDGSLTSASLSEDDFNPDAEPAIIQFKATLRQLGFGTTYNLNDIGTLTIYTYNKETKQLENHSPIISPDIGPDTPLDTVVTLSTQLKHFSVVFLGVDKSPPDITIGTNPEICSGGDVEVILKSNKKIKTPVSGFIKLPNGKTLEIILNSDEVSENINVYTGVIKKAISENMKGIATIDIIVEDLLGNTVQKKHNFEIDTSLDDVIVEAQPDPINTGIERISYTFTKMPAAGTVAKKLIMIENASDKIDTIKSDIFYIYKDDTAVTVTAYSYNMAYKEYFIDGINDYRLSEGTTVITLKKGWHKLTCWARSDKWQDYSVARLSISYNTIDSYVIPPLETVHEKLNLKTVFFQDTNIPIGKFWTDYRVTNDKNDGVADIFIEAVKYDGSVLNGHGSFKIWKNPPVINIAMSPAIAKAEDVNIFVDINRELAQKPVVIVYPASNTSNIYYVDTEKIEGGNKYAGIFSIINNNMLDGYYYISATCVDLAGNTGYGLADFLVDLKPPAIDIQISPRELREGYVSITITPSEQLKGKPMVMVKQSGYNEVKIQESDIIDSGNKYVVYYKVFSGFDGEAIVKVTANDLVGNTGSATAAFIVETTLTDFKIAAAPQYIKEGDVKIRLEAERNLSQPPEVFLNLPGNSEPLKITMFAEPVAGSSILRGNVISVGVTLGANYYPEKIKIASLMQGEVDPYPADGSWDNKSISIRDINYTIKNIFKSVENNITDVYIEIYKPAPYAVINEIIKPGDSWVIYDLSNIYEGKFTVDNTYSEGIVTINARGKDILGNEGKGSAYFIIDRTPPEVSADIDTEPVKLNTPVSVTITVSEKIQGLPNVSMMSSVTPVAKQLQVFSLPDENILLDNGILTANAYYDIEFTGNSIIARIFETAKIYDNEYYYGFEGKQIKINDVFYQIYKVSINTTLQGMEYMAFVLIDKDGNIVNPVSAGILPDLEWKLYDTQDKYYAKIIMTETDPQGQYILYSSANDKAGNRGNGNIIQLYAGTKLPEVSMTVFPRLNAEKFNVKVISNVKLKEPPQLEFLSAANQKEIFSTNEKIDIYPVISLTGTVKAINKYPISGFGLTVSNIILERYEIGQDILIPTDGSWTGKSIIIGDKLYKLNSLQKITGTDSVTEILATISDENGGYISDYETYGINVGNKWLILEHLYEGNIFIKQGITEPGWATITAVCYDIYGNSVIVSANVTVAPSGIAKPELVLNGKSTLNSIDLMWYFNAPNLYDIESFEIYRKSESQETYEMITKVAGNITSYRDYFTYSNYGNFDYYIIANDIIGSKIKSNEIYDLSFNTSGIINPYAPEIVSVDLIANTVTIVWTPPLQRPPASYISRYLIYRSTQPVMAPELLTTTADLQIKDLVPDGFVYYYRIAAEDIEGNTGNMSEEIKVSAIVSPNAPDNFTGIFLDNCIKLTWDAAVQGTYSISGYTLFKSTIPSVYEKSPVNGYNYITSTTYTDCKVNPQEKYYYIVKALDNYLPANFSPASAEIKVAGSIPPSAPLNLTATTGDGTVSLVWNASSKGSNELNGYVIMRSTGGEFEYIKTSFNPFYGDVDVTTGNVYSYYVYAIDTDGLTSSASNTVSIQVYKKPDAPQNVTATAGDTQIILSWEEVLPASSAIDSYKIYRTTIPEYYYQIENYEYLGSTTLTSYTDSGLTNDTKYYYYIKVSDVAGYLSVPSQIVSATPFLIKPGEPKNLTATAKDKWVRLSWDAPDTGTYPVSGYNIYRSTDAEYGNDWTKYELIDFTTPTIYDDYSVTNNATYYYLVLTIDTNGNSMCVSQPVTATPELILPGVVKNLIVQPKNDWVKLTWEKAEDGTYEISAYNILRSTDAVNYTLVASVTTNADIVYKYNDFEPVNGSGYYYRIETKDANNNTVCTNAVYVVPAGGLENSSYPIYGVNKYNRKRSIYSGPSSFNLYWKKNVHGEGGYFTLYSQFVTDINNVLYAGDNANQKINLYALNENSSFFWGSIQFDANTTRILNGSCSDSTLYTAASYHILNTEKSTGDLNWVKTGSDLIGGFTIDDNGNMYFSENDILYKRSGDMNSIWAYGIGEGNALSQPVIDLNGNIIVSAGTRLISMSPEGSINFNVETYNMLKEPMVKLNGNIVVCSNTNMAYIFDSNTGNTIVAKQMDNNINVYAINGNDDVILITSQAVVKLDNSGNTATIYVKPNQNFAGVLIIDENNKIYYTTDTNNEMVCLSNDGNLLWNFALIERNDISPVILPNGNMLAFSNDGSVYNIGNNKRISLSLTNEITQVKLNWSETVFNGNVNYEIYRSTSGAIISRNEGAYNKLTATTSIFYIDNTVEQQKPYFYRVFAIDEYNNLIASSDNVNIMLNDEYTSNNWLTYLHDNQRSGKINKDNNLKFPLSILGKFDQNLSHGRMIHLPVTRDGIFIYFNRYYYSGDDKIHAYSINTFKDLWTYSSDEIKGASILNDCIYFNEHEVSYPDSKIIKLNIFTGKQELVINKNIISRDNTYTLYEKIPVEYNNCIFITTELNTVKCFNETARSEKWLFAPPSNWSNKELYSPPAVWNDRLIYDTLTNVFALSVETGALLWDINIGQSNLSFERIPVALGSDGYIYIGDSNGNIHKINPENGYDEIVFTASGCQIHSNIINENNLIYVLVYDTSTAQKHIKAINKNNGSILWKTNIGSSLVNSMIVCDNRYLYFGVDNKLCIIDKKDGAIKYFNVISGIGGNLYTPSLYKDYIVFTESSGGQAIVLGSQINGPTSLTATAEDSKIILNWDVPQINTMAQISGYNIYKAITPDNITASANLILTTTENSYEDTNVVNETLYYYCITMTDTYGNESKPSPIAYAMPHIPTKVTIYVSDSSNERIIKTNYEKQKLWQYGINGKKGINNGYLNWPFGVHSLPDGNLLIAEKSNHRVIEVDESGNIVWHYGNPNNIFEGGEGHNINELSYPLHAQRLPYDNTLIVDSGNNRIIEVDKSGNIVKKWGSELSAGITNGLLNKPFYAEKLLNNNLLITDKNNHRVIEVDENGNIVWQYGNPTNIFDGGQGSGNNQLNNPVMAHRLVNGNTLITDKDNNRIIEVDSNKNIVWTYAGISGTDDNQLDNPIAAYQLTDPTRILIVDKANQRIQIINKPYKIALWQYGVTDKASDKDGYVNYPEDVSLEIIPPQAPLHITGTVDNKLINLIWDKGIDGSYPVVAYNIYRSTSTTIESAKKINDIPVFELQYADTSVINGNTYYYWLQSVDNNYPTGFSRLSEPVSFTPFERLSAPVFTTVYAQDKSICINWNYPVSGTYDVAYYNIYKRMDNENLTLYTTVTNTSYCETDLTNGIEYYYAVQAVDVMGNTGFTSEEVKLIPFAPPLAPLDLTATTQDIDIRLNWNQATQGTYAIDGYNIYRSTCELCDYLFIDRVGNTITEYLDRTIFKEGEYCYFIKTVDIKNHESDASNTVCAYIENVRPQPPQNLETFAGDAIVNLFWNEPYSKNPINYYTIYRSTFYSENLSDFILLTVTAAVNYADNDVINGITYYYIVTATDTFNIESLQSNIAIARPVAPPSAPELTGVLINNNSLLTWTITNTGTDEIDYYLIYKATSAESPFILINTVSNTQVSYSEDIQRNIDNIYYISALAGNVTGAASNTVNVRCNSNAGDITLTAIVYDSKINLSWSLSITATGTYAVSGYNVYRKLKEETEYKKITTIYNGMISEYEDTHVLNNVIYDYLVKEFDETGVEEIISNSISVRPRKLPESPILSLNIENENIILTWTKPDEGTDGIKNYNIYKSSGAGYYLLGNTGKQKFKDIEIVSGFEYIYYVAAVSNFSEEGPRSNTVLAYLEYIPPSKPDLSAIGSDQVIQLIWTVTPGTYTITGYDIYRSTDSVTYNLITTTVTNQFTDTGLTNGLQYYYYVIANDYSGRTSEQSNTVTVTPFALPEAPVFIEITTNDMPSINLTWVCSPTTYEISYYNIYRSTEGINYTLISQTANTSFTDFNVVQNTVYYYKLNAIDIYGNAGLYSLIASIMTQCKILSEPLWVSAIAGDSFITIEWDNTVLGQNGITGFNIYRSNIELNEFQKINNESVSGSPYLDTNVTNGEYYKYLVKAHNDYGCESAGTNIVIARPVSLPESITLTAEIINEYVQLTWTTPVAGTDPISYYNVFRATTPEGLEDEKISFFDSVTSTVYEDHRILEPGIYYYKVQPITDEGDTGDYSNIVSVTMTSFVTPPGGVTLTATGLVEKIMLNWTYSEKGTYDIKYYSIARSTSPGNSLQEFLSSVEFFHILPDINTTQYIDESVTTGVVYYYIVIPVDIYDNFGWSNTVSAYAISHTATGISLHYRTADSHSGIYTNSPHPQFKLYNNSNNSYDLSKIEIRYWYEYEGNGQAEESWVDWAGRLPQGNSITNETYVSIISGDYDASQNRYLKITFSPNAGYIANGENVEVQARFNKTDWSDYDQSNDWSFARYLDFTEWDNVTVYYYGVLIWGKEPVELTPTQTITFTITTTETPTITHTETATPTFTFTATPSFSPTATSIQQPTNTLTPTPPGCVVLDTGFGSNGIVTHHNAGGGNGADSGESIIITKSQNIYVTGSSARSVGPYSENIMALWRINNVGNVSVAFIYYTGQRNSGASLAEDNSGNIWITGAIATAAGTSAIDMALWKYEPVNTTGMLKLQYDNATGTNPGGFDTARSIKTYINPATNKEKVIIAGYSYNIISSNYDMTIYKYDIDTNGLDTSFGNNGVIVYNYGYNDFGYGIAVDKNNPVKIYVTGEVYDGAKYNMALWKYNDDGTPDTNFGNNGIVLFNDSIDYRYTGYDLTLDKLGNIYVTGSRSLADAYDVAVWKYDSNGNKVWGPVLHDSSGYDEGFGIEIDTCGRILVTGVTDGHLVVLRYTNNGAPDLTFGNGTEAIPYYDITGYTEGKRIAVYNEYNSSQGNYGKIVITGSAYMENNGMDMAVLRYIDNCDVCIPVPTATDTPTLLSTVTLTNTVVPSSTASATEVIALTETFTLTLTPSLAVTLTQTLTNTISPTPTLIITPAATPEGMSVYPGSGTDIAGGVTEGGSFAIAGRTDSFGAGGFDVFMLKTDEDGNEQSRTVYGGVDNDAGNSIIWTGAGYLIAGETMSYGAGGKDIYLVKTDVNGNVEWTKTYGGAGDDVAYSVITTGSGYLIAGETTSYGVGGKDVYLIKTDVNGNVEWTKTYGGVGDDAAYSVAGSSYADTYMLAGYTSESETNKNIYLLYIDSYGNNLWNEIFGGEPDDIAYSVIGLSNGDFVVVGETGTFGMNGTDAFLLRISSLILPIPTYTVTASATFVIPSLTNTITPSPTITETITPTLTRTITLINTFTITPSKTKTLTHTRTNTLTQTPTLTRTFTKTKTPTKTSTSTITPTRTMTPVPVAIILEFKAGDIYRYSASPHPQFRIKNKGTGGLNITKLEIRYWYKYDGAVKLEESYIDWAGVNGNPITDKVNIGIITGSFGTQDRYLKITFKPDAGNLGNGINDYLEVNTRFNKSDWSQYDQANDWSFINYTSFTQWDKVTVYYDGVLVYGQGPGMSPSYISKEQEAKEIADANVFCYPNPAKEKVIIRFSMNKQESVKIEIKDIKGEIIWQKEIAGTEMRKGINNIEWDLTDNRGNKVSNGVYIYKIIADDKTIIKKLTVVR